jgi:hypothetical protein
LIEASKTMKIQQCEREQNVIDALKSGRWAGPWGEEIRKHAAGCAVCSEVVFVATAMRREDELVQAELRLPSAGLVWWKAQRAARRDAEQRATQPIAWAERMAQFMGVLAVLGLIFWQWPRIAAWLGETKGLTRVPASGLAEWSRNFFDMLGHGFGQSPIYLVLVSAGAFLMLVGFAAYAVWREE